MSAVVHSLFDAGEIAPGWLKSELAKAPRSQADLGRWMGISQSAVCRMCSGERKISLSDARDINAYLDATCVRTGNAPKSGAAAPTSDIVIQAQHEIEVYRNPSGGIVVKMEAGGVYDEDQVVVIRPENVDAVVAALLRVKREDQR